MRITTSAVLTNYRADLSNSTAQLDYSRNKVLSGRNFNSYAEDPASATLAFQLRRQHSTATDQLNNTTALISKYEAAWNGLSTAKNLVEEGAKEVSLRVGSDSTGAGRQPLGEVMTSSAESIVQAMNASYGGSFVFAGNDGDTVPFSWDNGNLLYRGIRVDSPEGSEDYELLQQMAAEDNFIDVGSGLAEVNGELVDATAFNSALSGIQMLGFGVDEDGDPKNAISIMAEIGEILSDCDPDSGAYATAADEEDAERLGQKLEDAMHELINEWTNLDGQANYLNLNESQLDSTIFILNEQVLNLEQVDLADAITEFSWAQYSYNAALKVGNSILSESLMDYMT